MKRFQIITICLLACSALADTNELERARAAYMAARRAYMAAREAAGLTNAPRKVSSSATILTKSQRKFFENRRICVSRDTTTIPGSVITTWYRNGKPDTLAPAVVTNLLQKIAGSVQSNPLQELAERMRQRAEQWQLVAKELEVVATNNAMRVDRVAHALDERRAEYVDKRDKAALPTTKAIYQAFIDVIDRLKEKLAEGGV